MRNREGKKEENGEQKKETGKEAKEKWKKKKDDGTEGDKGE